MPGWILESSDELAITLRVPSGSIKTIGRTARADFIVDAALISRLHCRLTADKSDQLVVEDLGSTNGTMVNGKKVDRVVLRAGDKLTVGTGCVQGQSNRVGRRSTFPVPGSPFYVPRSSFFVPRSWIAESATWG